MGAHSLLRTRPELSAFLRHHRRRLTPADVGLPSGGRRRTPGLRREEVAALAGVGLTWYTWFEQGRDIGVSESFLLNVAKALRLDDAECCHLFLLAQRRPPPAETYQSERISPLMQQLLDEIVARPAYVTNLRWDVIAWNAAADRLLGLAALGAEERNIMRMVFTDPIWRRRLPEWPGQASRLLEQFRCDLAAVSLDGPVLALVEDLKKLSPDFKRWWMKPDFTGYGQGIGAIVDDNGKRREFRHEMLIVDEHRHLRMVAYFET